MITDTQRLWMGKAYEGLSGWNNHRPLLMAACLVTEGTILEYGAGDGSTPLLHEYSLSTGRAVMTLESNPSWGQRMRRLWAGPTKAARHGLKEWQSAEEMARDLAELYATAGEVETRVPERIVLLPASVALIDHAPSERRVVDILALADRVDYLVIHDSEPQSKHYRLDEVRDLFPHWYDYKAEGAWASIASRRMPLEPVLKLVRSMEPNR